MLLWLDSSSSFSWRHPSHSRIFASAKLVNNTIDDTSSQLAYVPATSWHPSTVPCGTCLTPSSSLANNGTWHEGVHIIPTVDGDDAPGKDGDNNTAQPSSSTSSPAPTPKVDSQGGDADDGGSGKGPDGDDGQRGAKGKGKREDLPDRPKRRSGDLQDVVASFQRDRRQSDPSNPFFIPNFDSDDAGFVDTPLLAEFNFTGASY